MRIPTSKQDKGFTLIELLVVVVIIGILAAVAIPVFLNQREKAAEAGLKSDLKNTATLMETYYVDNRAYPTTTGALTSLGFKTTDGNTVAVTGTPGTSFCLAGTLKGAATPKFWYDSDGGGLVTSAC